MNILKSSLRFLLALAVVTTFLSNLLFTSDVLGQTVSGDDYFYVNVGADINGPDLSHPDHYYFEFNWSYSDNGDNWVSGSGFKSALADKVKNDFGSSYANKVRDLVWPLEVRCSEDSSGPEFICTTYGDFNPPISNYPMPTGSYTFDLGDGVSVNYDLTYSDHGDGPDSNKTYIWSINMDYPQPTANINSDKSKIIEGENQEISLSWGSENGSSWYIARDSTDGTELEDIRDVDSSGSRFLSPSQTTIYTLTTWSQFDSSVTAEDTVTVNVNHKPVGDVSASPNSATVGETSTIDSEITDEEGGWMWYQIEIIAPDGTEEDKDESIHLKPNEIRTLTNELTLDQEGTWWVGLHVLDYSDDVWAESDWVSINSEAAPTVTATISASDENIIEGDSSTLTWGSTNADSCTGTNFDTEDGNNGTPTADNLSVTPTDTTTYTVTCTNSYGSDSASVTVEVNPAPTASITADSTNVIEGDSTLVDWNSSNTNNCSITDDSDGSVISTNPNNSSTEYPNTTRSYTITCEASDMTVTDSVTVYVSAPGSAPETNISASPNSVTVNEDSTLTSTITDPEGGWMWYQIEIIAPDGTKEYNGDIDLNPNEIRTLTNELTLDQEGTWWVGLHVYDYSDGVWAESDWVSINSEAAPTVTATISASDENIIEGDSSTLTWGSTNADSCTGTNFDTEDGNNGTPTADNLSVTPTDTTTYTVTCTNSYGSDSASVDVIIGYKAEADISASPNSVTVNEDSTLTSTITDPEGGWMWYEIEVVSPDGSRQYIGGEDESWVEVDSSTGELTFTKGLNANNIDLDQEGTWLVGLHVLDSANDVWAESDWTSIQVGSVPQVTTDVEIYNPETSEYEDGPVELAYGESMYFRWNSTYASGCTSPDFSTSGAESGYDRIATDTTGSETVDITCTSSFNNDTASDSVTADFYEDEPTDGSSLSLSVDPTSIQEGGRSMLAYDGSGIVSGSCSIDQGIGSVPGTSDQRYIRPTSDTTYTITCDETSSNGGGTISDNATIYVDELNVSCDYSALTDDYTITDHTICSPSDADMNDLRANYDKWEWSCSVSNDHIDDKTTACTQLCPDNYIADHGTWKCEPEPQIRVEDWYLDPNIANENGGTCEAFWDVYSPDHSETTCQIIGDGGYGDNVNSSSDGPSSLEPKQSYRLLCSYDAPSGETYDATSDWERCVVNPEVEEF